MFNTILVAVDESKPAQRGRAILPCKLALEDHASTRAASTVIDVSKLITAPGYDSPYPAETLDIMRTAGAASCSTRRKAACRERIGLKVIDGGR